MLRSPVKVLDDADLRAVLDLCEHDPVANVFVSSRVAAVGCDPRKLGGELWGYWRHGRLVSACWAGANLVPVETEDAAVEAFAARARRQGRRCSSMVGRADSVLGMWDRLDDAWGPAREVRPDQPLMAISTGPLVAPDPLVRRTTSRELDLLYPACVAMFTEEVGYSPEVGDGGTTYRRRVSELVGLGRSFSRIERLHGRDQVVFKAELGAVAPGVVQVQGVWVHPELRGRGLAAPGMAAVVALSRELFTWPDRETTVSLYVNAYNRRAVAAYERVGFRRVGSFATVLF
ncbi:MAG: GNAT family N-acetyltransferase [Actinomycetota bacterium]